MSFIIQATVSVIVNYDHNTFIALATSPSKNIMIYYQSQCYETFYIP